MIDRSDTLRAMRLRARERAKLLDSMSRSETDEMYFDAIEICVDQMMDVLQTIHPEPRFLVASAVILRLFQEVDTPSARAAMLEHFIAGLRAGIAQSE